MPISAQFADYGRIRVEQHSRVDSSFLQTFFSPCTTLPPPLSLRRSSALPLSYFLSGWVFIRDTRIVFNDDVECMDGFSKSHSSTPHPRPRRQSPQPNGWLLGCSLVHWLPCSAHIYASLQRNLKANDKCLYSSQCNI